MDATRNCISVQHHHEQSQDGIEEKLGVRECRICLEGGQEEGVSIISPCRCTGSMRYVHEECLGAWIEKIVNKSEEKIEGEKACISCELCQGKISFEVHPVVKCKSREQAVAEVKKNFKTLIALILLLLINLGFFAALLDYLLKYGFSTLVKNNQVLVSLLISGQVIFSIVAVVTTHAIVWKFLLNRQFVVRNIVDGKQNGKGKEKGQKLFGKFFF